MNTCSNCRHAISLKAAGSTDLAKLKSDAMECRAHPPTVNVILVPQGPQGLGVNAISGHPQVMPTHYCGEWAPERPVPIDCGEWAPERPVPIDCGEWAPERPVPIAVAS